MKYFTLILALFLKLSWAQSQNQIDTIFNASEAETMHQIVEFYDAFVFSKTSIDLSVDSAYLKFLDEFLPKAFLNNDLGFLIPDENEKLEFYKGIDQDALSEIFLISDSTEAYNPKTGESKMVPYAYYFQLNYQGKFKQFLEAMSIENDFLFEIHSNMIKSNTFSPTVWSSLPKEHKKMDFSSPDQRLVLAVMVLSLTKQIYYD